ncbi:hypothetical protein [Streptomyces sp. NPDC048277]|uniref:hypothetical protein n=1 Tax=Streptomyces sp. NPDC048277 TaxID=3155027 RepID=UPI0033F7FA78
MDDTPSRTPTALPTLRSEARDAGFSMSSEDRTGSLLAALAAARPAGRILELDPAVQAVARKQLGADPRVAFVTGDGGAWPEGHDASVERLLAELDEREDFRCVRMAWASGLLMAVRTT